MWPFSSEDDVATSISSSGSWNNLNIPPDATSDGWLTRFGPLFYLIGPVALAYVHWRSRKEDKLCPEDIVAKIEEKQKLACLKEMRKFQEEKEKLIKKEEVKAAATLRRLNKVEDDIKDILDIHCSKMNPWKTRFDREKIERELSLYVRDDEELQHLGIEEGIQHILRYDYKHCADNSENNGQIYRVWMKHWRAMVQKEKEKRLVDQLHDVLNNVLKIK